MASASGQTRQMLVKMARLAFHEWGLLSIGLAALVVGVLMEVFYPQAIRFAIDAILSNCACTLRNFKPAIAALLVSFAMLAATAAIAFWAFSMAGASIVADFRGRLFHHITRQDISWFDQQETGVLVNRLSVDAEQLKRALTTNLGLGVRNALSVIGASCLLFYTAPPLAWIVVLLALPLKIGALAVGAYIERNGDHLARNRYRSAIGRSVALDARIATREALFIGVSGFLAHGSFVFVLWMGLRMVMTGVLTPGGLVSVALYTFIATTSAACLAALWNELMTAVGATGELFALLESEPRLERGFGRCSDQFHGSIPGQPS